MRIIRKPATGKPRGIVCTGCGRKAFEAGIAVNPEVVETGYGDDPDRLITMIDDEDAFPLCEDCVTTLERAEDVLRVHASSNFE
jgi:hypothetical protein